MDLPASVTIREVGMRDGLQTVATILPPAEKVALIDALGRTGLRRIEAVAFVHPVVAASETFDRKNVRMSVDDPPASFEQRARRADSARVPLTGVVSTAFGYPYEGDVTTRGVGMANVLAGRPAGARVLAGLLGGLGGCPFAPRAAGHVCAADLVHLLAALGGETGLDLDRLGAGAHQMEALLGQELPGPVLKAGRRGQVYVE